jgi:hypothetical protein
MDQIKQDEYKEDLRVHELVISLREPSIYKKYQRVKKDSSQYLTPLNYGLRVGLVTGLILGSIFGAYKTAKTKNPYYIPITAFVYSGIFGVGNSVFYLIRS